MGAASFLVPVAISAVGEGVSMDAQEQAEHFQQQAIQQRMTQEQIAADNTAIQRGRQMQQIISAQQAAAGARGFDVASASFKAISEDTFNQYAQDVRGDNLNEEMQLGEMQEESDLYKQQYKAGISKDLFDLGSTMFAGRSLLHGIGSSSINSSWGASPGYAPVEDISNNYQIGMGS